jgi:hypothetical protein
MRAGHVADVCGSAVGLHLKKLLEVDLFPFGFKLLRALLRGVHQGFLGGRHAPARHHDLAATGRVTHDWRRIVREDAGHAGQVSDAVVESAEQPTDRVDVLRHGIKIAHATIPPAALGGRAAPAATTWQPDSGRL